MNALIATRARRFAWSFVAFVLAVGLAIWITRSEADPTQPLTDGQLMTRLLAMPALLAVAVLALTTCTSLVT